MRIKQFQKGLSNSR